MAKDHTKFYGNQNAAKYKTQEQLQTVIDQYFAKCDKEKRPYTMSGLALQLGIDRTTLVRYGDKELFANQIKEAKSRVQAQLEENALSGKGNAVFTIFNLKNNYGWRDQVEVTNDEELNKVKELLSKINNEANK